VKRSLLALSLLGSVVLGTSATAAPALAGSPTAPDSVTIRIVSFAYHSNDVTVAPGAEIRVKNIDGEHFGVPHSLTGQTFDTGVFTTGTRIVSAPWRPGRYMYICRVHGPSMYGFINVASG
jgi:plastocyanin